MICHPKPVLEVALRALKNLRGDRLAANIDRRHLFFKREKNNRLQKNQYIKFKNSFDKTFTYSNVLNHGAEGSISAFGILHFPRFLHSNIT